MSDDRALLLHDPSQLRVMWLLNHGTARTFELRLLKEVGFRQFFLPKLYPSDPSFRSASVDWSEDAHLDIPVEDLAILNAADWYRDPGKRAWDVANRHFHLLFFIVHDVDMLRAIGSFAGAAIWRAYGQQHPVMYSRLASQSNRGVQTIRKLGRRFFLATAYAHLADAEPPFITTRAVYLPIGLDDATPRDNWTGDDARILFVCPDIEANAYYGGIHRQFVRDFGTLPHAIAGMQAVRAPGPTILGYTPRDVHDRNMQHFRAMFYHSREPNHVHYHPFEAVRAGMPLVFMADGLLDRLGGRALPGRCTSIAEARSKLERLLAGDQLLIDALRSTQPVLLDAMKPDACLPAWRTGVARILDEAAGESIAIARRPKAAPRIAVVVPVGYRGGTFESAKLVCEALRVGSANSGNQAEIVLAHVDDDAVYSNRDFAGLHRAIRRRPFKWVTLDTATAQRAMTFVEPLRAPLSGEHLVADDGIRQLMDCDLWLVVSDRLPLPLLPLRPYAMLVFDYLQRYVDFLPQQSNAAFVDAAHRADRVLVTTRFTWRDAVDFAGIATHKLRLVPMIAPLVDAPQPRDETPRRPYFLWPTNLGPHKNHANAWKALQRYWGSRTDTLDCHVTGVGTDQLWQRGLASSQDSRSGERAIEWGRRIELHGELDDSDYRRLTANARFIWHPTTIDNGGLSVVEAAQLGVPALSSDYPAMREIQQRFELDVTWSDPGDPVDMAQGLAGMQAATSDGARRPARIARDRIGADACASDYWDALADLL